MSNYNAVDRVVSAIISDPKTLEDLVNVLHQEGFGRHDISIQGDPFQLESKLDDKYIDPEKLQQNPETPVRNPFLSDDIGWLLGAMIAVPTFFVVVALLIIFWEEDSVIYNYLTAGVGVVIGCTFGAFIAWLYHRRLKKQEARQFKKGGKVIWIHAKGREQINLAKKLLKDHRAKSIMIKKLSPGNKR